MICAPSTLSELEPTLRARASFECQRLLTEEKRACGGALELLEGRVGFESFGKVLGGVRTELVGPETVSEGDFRVSAAIDSREKGVWRRT